jgi:hypothetical protein
MQMLVPFLGMGLMLAAGDGSGDSPLEVPGPPGPYGPPGPSGPPEPPEHGISVSLATSVFISTAVGLLGTQIFKMHFMQHNKQTIAPVVDGSATSMESKFRGWKLRQVFNFARALLLFDALIFAYAATLTSCLFMLSVACGGMCLAIILLTALLQWAVVDDCRLFRYARVIGVTASFAFGLLVPLYFLNHHNDGVGWPESSCRANDDDVLLPLLLYVSKDAAAWLQSQHAAGVDGIRLFLASSMGPAYFVAGAFCTPHTARTRTALTPRDLAPSIDRRCNVPPPLAPPLSCSHGCACCVCAWVPPCAQSRSSVSGYAVMTC